MQNTKVLFSYPITDLDRPLYLQEFEPPRISRQFTHEGGMVTSPMQWSSWTLG